MWRSSIRSTAVAVATLGLVVAACASDDSEQSVQDAERADGEPTMARTDTDDAAAEVPTIVVTTNILGDVVGEVLGDAAEVVTIMPVGADPHAFQASAQEVDAIMSADALIANGAEFEEGLLDVLANAEGEGIPAFEAISAVETIEFGAGGDDHDDDADHDDEVHDDADHDDAVHDDEVHDDADHDGHDHSGADPHFFTDPVRMAAAVEEIVDFLQNEVEFADPAALDASADVYVAALTALDGEVDELVASIPDQDRVLVTNHDVFGYFADRYGFDVVGVVVPGGSTTEGVSAGELAELVEVVEAAGVPAIFADNSASDELVETLAGEVGEITIVTLYTGSLGDDGSDGATYLDMVRSNAERISDALS